MHQRRHPLSGALYDVRHDGLVQVDDRGTTGVFTAEGDWVSGELRHADAHLCGWLAGIRSITPALNPKNQPVAESERRMQAGPGLRDLATIVRDVSYLEEPR
jgi:hypothetical protein